MWKKSITQLSGFEFTDITFENPLPKRCDSGLPLLENEYLEPGFQQASNVETAAGLAVL